MADIDTVEWQQRYRRLLEAADMQAVEFKGAAAPRVTGADDRAGSLSLAEGLRDPARIRRWLDEHRRPGSPREKRAAAAVLQQDLSLQMLAPLTIRLLLEGRTALPGPEDLVLLDTDAPYCWVWNGVGPVVDTAAFIPAISARLLSWYPVFRSALRVAPGAYWSSAGLALSAPFSALYNRAPPEWLCREASDWLARFPCPASRYIDWIPARLADNRCALPQRRGCCLRFATPAAEYCGTCGIYRKERMQALAVENEQ